MKEMLPELFTIVALGLITLSAIFAMPPDSAEKVALALGGMLGGYLTKTAIDAIKKQGQ